MAVAVHVDSSCPSVVLADEGIYWFAIYTCVNQEKMVAERLRDRGIEQFCPTFQSVRRRSDRRVILDLPVFPGYLFARIGMADRKRVLEVPRVVRIVGTRSVLTPLPDSEIQMLRQGLTSNTTALPCEPMKKGRRIRVLRGPFEGTVGTLMRRKRGFRLVLSMDLIQRAFSIEVGEEDVEYL